MNTCFVASLLGFLANFKLLKSVAHCQSFGQKSQSHFFFDQSLFIAGKFFEYYTIFSSSPLFAQIKLKKNGFYFCKKLALLYHAL